MEASCCVRSNYFEVTNKERFKDIIGAAGYSYWQNDEEMYAFGQDGGYGSPADMICISNDEGEEEEMEFAVELQKILCKDQVCIIHENISENLHYINAFATIITDDDIDTIDFRDIITARAIEMKPGIVDKHLVLND